MSFPPDPNEAFRLQALKGLDRICRRPDEALDRITSFARSRFEVPACLISVIGAEEQINLSRQGTETATLPRERSFCTYAIVQPDVFVVENAALDTRFLDNPLVTDEPYLRFYAGAPLVYERDTRLGTLCVFDHKPRSFSPGDRAELQMLADHAASVIINRVLGIAEPDISAALYD